MRTYLKWCMIYTSIAGILMLSLSAFLIGIYYMAQADSKIFLYVIAAFALVVGLRMAAWESGR